MKFIVAGVGIFFGCVCVLEFFGLRWNVSDSMPHTLYKINTSGALKRGEIVLICPTPNELQIQARQRGYLNYSLRCSDWFPPLIKPVAALAGDVVSITLDRKIQVNGSTLANSEILSTDGDGLPLSSVNQPLHDYQVLDGELWIVSTHHPRSWDSRYYGPIPVSNILGIVEPIF